MRLIFRYDDFSASPAVALDVDHAVFTAFAERSLPLLVGVTPRMAVVQGDPSDDTVAAFETDRDRIAWLRDGLRVGWEVALHGFDHRARSRDDRNEFAGRSRTEQLRRLEAGRAILRRCLPGAAVDVLIPPWNRFDGTTLDAAADAGFRWLLCGARPAVTPVHEAVRVVPSLIDLPTLVAHRAHLGLTHLQKLAGDATLVVTLHGYDMDGPAATVTSDALAALLDEVVSRRFSEGAIGDLLRHGVWVPARPHVFRDEVYALSQVRSIAGSAIVPRAARITRSAALSDAATWASAAAALHGVAHTRAAVRSSTALDRLRRAHRRHGLAGLVRHAAVAGWNRVAHDSTHVFVRPAGAASGPPPPDVIVGRYTDSARVPPDVVAELVTEEGPAVERQIRAELDRGAELWVASCDGRVAAYQYTIRGNRLGQWFVPLAPDDVVVFSTVTLPAFRGRRIARVVTDHALDALLRPGDRAFIDTKEWNRAAMRYIADAGFTPVNTTSTVTEPVIGGRV